MLLPSHPTGPPCQRPAALLLVCTLRVWGLTARIKPPPTKIKAVEEAELCQSGSGSYLLASKKKFNLLSETAVLITIIILL